MVLAVSALADTLVFGGTRGIGLETVRLLAGKGEAVTVLVRATSDLTALNEIDGVSTTVGDAMDMASVTQAFAAGEYQVVVSTLGGSLQGGFAVDSQGMLTQNTSMLGGISRAEVARLVAESVGSAATFGKIYSAIDAPE
jgi:uncharacterized protein YbjT (DUF2867 family)